MLCSRSGELRGSRRASFPEREGSGDCSEARRCRHISAPPRSLDPNRDLAVSEAQKSSTAEPHAGVSYRCRKPFQVVRLIDMHTRSNTTLQGGEIVHEQNDGRVTLRGQV